MNSPALSHGGLSCSPWRPAGNRLDYGVILDAAGATVATVSRTIDAGAICALPRLVSSAFQACHEMHAAVEMLRGLQFVEAAAALAEQHDQLRQAVLAAFAGVQAVDNGARREARMPS